jgi:signal transduction histidine kinase
MMLVSLDGSLETDTAEPNRVGSAFPFSDLLATAAVQDKATGLAALGNRIYWIVAVPVRAPVPIAFIVACIPVDHSLLERLRALSSESRRIILARRGEDRRWRVVAGAGGRGRLPKLLLPADLSRAVSNEANWNGGQNLIVAARLETAKGSAPVAAVLSYPLDEALAAYRSVLLPLLLLLAVALIVAVAGAMIIVRGVSRPLEILASAARRIAAGDYTAPPKLQQRDEVGHLADALINMTQSIAEREAALKQAIDSTEIARNEAVRANEAKSHFLANMSHELRTPLNAIVGFSEMLEQQVLGPVGVPRYVDYARDIGTSGVQLLTMVERMLDLAEAEAHRLRIDKSGIDPVELLRQAMASLAHFAQQQKVRTAFTGVMDTALRMEGDAIRLRQAFTNLLHNAIKFTPAGGGIRVDVRLEGCLLSIRIEDAGTGMEPELLASVVRPFHRLRSALDGQHQGAGLGLPFAKAVIELHGGQLNLASELGEGTTAVIELPVRAVSVSEAA